MKHYFQNSLRALFLSLSMLLSLPMLAFEVEVDGINYELNPKRKVATVIAKSSGKYSGDIVIPESVEYEGRTCSVTSIGERAFRECSGLTSVTIGNSVTSIGESAFYYCSGLTSVTIPNSVTSIGEWAFRECSGLTSVTIPNSVTSIGDRAFSGCSGLTSVHISDIAAWCNIGFDTYNSYNSNPLYYAHHLYLNGEEVKDLVIPNNVKSIDNGAFYGCSGLTSVTIGNSVRSIGEEAFSGCKGLTSVTIPNSVTSIGKSAFLGCSGLTSVHISDIAAWCNIEFYSGGSNPISYAHHLYLNGEEVKDLVIPNSVTSIGEWAFYKCSGLTSVTIPNSVTSIGDRAFMDCSNLEKIELNCKYIGSWFSGSESIKEIIIGNSVKSIGEEAFRDCSGLTSVTIPNSVTSIGNYAFYVCDGLTSVHISDIAAWCNIDFGDNPLEYAHHLYMNGEEVKDLVIPNSVTSIGERAFSGCSGLTSVTIPNSVTSIGNYAFSRCSGLTSVTIPNSVTSLGDSAFYGCSGLTSVTIPNSVTSLGDGAFSSCSGLTSVTIPNSVKSIGEYAFSRCSGLTSVTIPNSVTSIGWRAFYKCSGLTSVSIHSGVETIGSESFANCPELLDVYCFAWEVPSANSDAFDGSDIEYATLHVPDNRIKSYKATEPWSGFGEIVALTDEETGIEKLKSENGTKASVLFDLNGRRVQKAQKGLYIQNGRKVLVK